MVRCDHGMGLLLRRLVVRHIQGGVGSRRCRADALNRSDSTRLVVDKGLVCLTINKDATRRTESGLTKACGWRSKNRDQGHLDAGGVAS